YGKLYNWYALNDPRGLAPIGWHISNDEEWIELTDFLGGESSAGGKLKAKNTLWEAPNTGATNSSGFTGLPGGYRDAQGNFYSIGYTGYWWCSTDLNDEFAWFRSIDYYAKDSFSYYDYKKSGFSVRCVKN
ncbi:MAG: fibrobacter succinogenes major paralogous domain-containing protein, partial [Flavobacterium sp.]